MNNVEYRRNAGVLIGSDGSVYSKTNALITPLSDKSGYYFIPDIYLDLPTPSGEIETANGTKVRGKYLHRMVVFTFGDRNHSPYNSNLVIDHIDMNHKNNSVENLQQITQLRNLWRAYYLCRGEKQFKLFSDEYKRVKESPTGEIELKQFKIEMEIDIKKYGGWEE